MIAGIAPSFRMRLAAATLALSMLAAVTAVRPHRSSYRPLNLPWVFRSKARRRQPRRSLRRRRRTPGLINEMGKLFDKMLPPMKSPGEAIDDLNARASDALSRLKPGAMIKGRMACPATAGTPDCKFGADKLCQSKGYKEGKSSRHRFRRDLLCEGSDPGTAAQAR